jgi:hypothetical protein
MSEAFIGLPILFGLLYLGYSIFQAGMEIANAIRERYRR